MVYPNPALVNVIGVVIVPALLTVAVAIAVVPRPTPTVGGAEILMSTVDPLYPLPPFNIANEEIVPPEPTVAVTLAPEETLVSTIIAPNEYGEETFYLNKS